RACTTRARGRGWGVRGDPTVDGWWETVLDDLGDARPDVTLRDAPVDAPMFALPRITLGQPGDAARRHDHADLRLGEPIGEGGMGIVYVAQQDALEREVAVKRARSADPRAGAALLREARFMGQLEHPNVIPVHVL